MKYINKKTQAVIETACVIAGGEWVKVEVQPEAEEKPKTTKSQPKKNTKKSVVSKDDM